MYSLGPIHFHWSNPAQCLSLDLKEQLCPQYNCILNIGQFPQWSFFLSHLLASYGLHPAPPALDGFRIWQQNQGDPEPSTSISALEQKFFLTDAKIEQIQNHTLKCYLSTPKLSGISQLASLITLLLDVLCAIYWLILLQYWYTSTSEFMNVQYWIQRSNEQESLVAGRYQAWASVLENRYSWYSWDEWPTFLHEILWKRLIYPRYSPIFGVGLHI